MSVQTIIRTIRNPKTLALQLGERGYLKWMPDKIYLRLVYRFQLGRKLNLKQPLGYSEKIQWTKLYDRKKIYNTYVDKYLVRDYIAKTIGAQYLIDLINVYDHVDDIVWEDLPKAFVLKCTHGSNCNVICPDKDQLDIEEAKKNLRRWMKKNWYWYGREWAYKDLKPRIICERYMSDTGDTPDDYKIICLSEVARVISIHRDRYTGHTIDCFDTDFNYIDVVSSYPSSDRPISRPEYLDEMLALSEKLAKGTYITRIDWYVIGGKLYFGEITMYEGSGFVKKNRPDIDKMFGDWIKLPSSE